MDKGSVGMSGAVLFTNCAAGELSDTLFGRIDIPFSHTGGSHLANVDVISTGGIQRRKGSKQMKARPAAYAGSFLLSYTHNTHLCLYSA
jgi:hypothetical protein